MKNKIVALLPIKEHSERVPSKNFKILKNKPLYKWILDTLLDVSCIDKIIVNTDSEQLIEQLTDQERILVRKRKKEICGDFVSMNKVILDDINNIEAETFIMTHATNPFLKSETILAGLEIFKNESCDSVFSVNKIQSRFYDKNVKAVNHDPEELIRTQDLEPFFEENSCLYIFSKNSFLQNENRIGNKPLFLETNLLESHDIDTLEDWKLAEYIAGGQGV